MSNDDVIMCVCVLTHYIRNGILFQEIFFCQSNTPCNNNNNNNRKNVSLFFLFMEQKIQPNDYTRHSFISSLF